MAARNAETLQRTRTARKKARIKRRRKPQIKRGVRPYDYSAGLPAERRRALEVLGYAAPRMRPPRPARKRMIGPGVR